MASGEKEEKKPEPPKGIESTGDFWKDVTKTYETKCKEFIDLTTEEKQYDVILFAEGKWTPVTISRAKISVKKANDIKSTSLVSRTGSVKELIQAKDYEVKISGTLIGVPRAFPYGELILLNRVLSTSKSIWVASTYLASFGIFRLVFKETTFAQAEYINNVPFTLVFDSDYNYNFLTKGDSSGFLHGIMPNYF